MGFVFTRKIASIIWYVNIHRFIKSDVFFYEKIFLNIRLCDKRFYIVRIYCYQNHDSKKERYRCQEKNNLNIMSEI